MVMSDRLIVNTQVDETDLALIKLGQKAFFTLDAYPDHLINGRVGRIAYQSTMVNNVTTYEVDVWPLKAPSFMRSGMTANVVFNLSIKNKVLVVPTEALQQTSDGDFFVMKAPTSPDSGPQTQVIQTGFCEGKKMEVISGLKEGDKVLFKNFVAAQLAPQNLGTNPFMPSPKKTVTNGKQGDSGPPPPT